MKWTSLSECGVILILTYPNYRQLKNAESRGNSFPWEEHNNWLSNTKWSASAKHSALKIHIQVALYRLVMFYPYVCVFMYYVFMYI